MKSAFELGASFLLSIITLCSLSLLNAQSALGLGSPSLSRLMTISDSGRALVEKPTDRLLVQGGLNGRIKDNTLVANLNPPISQTPLANPRSLYVQFFDGIAVGLDQGDDGITRTGMAAVDELNEEYGCTSIEKRFYGKTLKKDNDLDRSYIFAFTYRTAIDVEEARKRFLATGAFRDIQLDTVSFFNSSNSTDGSYPIADRHSLYVSFKADVKITLTNNRNSTPGTSFAPIDEINAQYGCNRLGKQSRRTCTTNTELNLFACVEHFDFHMFTT